MVLSQKKTILTIVALCFLILPLVIYARKIPMVASIWNIWFPHAIEQAPKAKYMVETEADQYHVSLVDNTFWDYITAKYNLFADHAVVDPKRYAGQLGNMNGYSVKNIKFVLVPDMPAALSMVAAPMEHADDDITAVGKYTYLVDNDTLILQIYLNTSYLTRNAITPSYSLEKVFIEMALLGMQAALGNTDSNSPTPLLSEVDKQIQDNLYSGILPWPVKIARP